MDHQKGTKLKPDSNANWSYMSWFKNVQKQRQMRKDA